MDIFIIFVCCRQTFYQRNIYSRRHLAQIWVCTNSCQVWNLVFSLFFLRKMCKLICYLFYIKCEIDLDDDEPYSPGGSDDDDSPLSTILTSHLSRTNANPVPDYTVPAELGVQRQAKDTIMTGFQELNFKQEMELQVTANSLEQVR